MVGDMSRVTLNFDLSKNSFCAFLARVKTYIVTPKIKHKHGSHLRAVTDDDDDDDAGRHSTTTRATYR